MKYYYFTFGQSHIHRVSGRTFDKDCVAGIQAENSGDARAMMFKNFGNKWHNQYDTFEQVPMKYFPRGIIKLP